MLVEFNVISSVEGPQLIAGPHFGQYLEEVVDRLGHPVKEKLTGNRISFANGNAYDFLSKK